MRHGGVFVERRPRCALNGNRGGITSLNVGISSVETAHELGETGIGGSGLGGGHRSMRSITASTTIFAKLETQVPPIKCLVYIGLPENPQFLGPQDPDGLARHILKSRGPSGENKEYLFLLEKSLLELSKDSGDDHVSDLVRRCREIEAEEATTKGEDLSGGDDAVDSKERESLGEPLHRHGSTEEQEEVEK
jgi:glutathione-specific gamma-glutamylcyclotransferase